jgi:hypothetical protein
LVYFCPEPFIIISNNNSAGPVDELDETQPIALMKIMKILIQLRPTKNELAADHLLLLSSSSSSSSFFFFFFFFNFNF